MKTPTEIILRSCTDKRSLSKAEADNTIDYYAKKQMIMYYYKCDFCNRFHVSKYSESNKTLQILGGKTLNPKENAI